MTICTDFPYAVQVTEDQRITLPDGITLSARLWRPETETPVPLILEFLPYRKRDGTIARDEMMHPWYAGMGYAALRVDMRGNGDSQGLMADEYTAQELQDACDVIAWARAQDWCSGKVGMQGISWGGFNALQVAALQPEGLEAIITICSTVDRFADDIHYKGGCLLGENFGWAAQMLSYSSRPPDPALVGEDWRAMWLERLEAQPFLLSEWLRHSTRDAYWKHGSVCEDYSAIKAKVLSIGGWHDGYRNTPAHLATNVAGTKAIVGPWNHKYPFYAGPEPRIGFLREAKTWWDRWLKDIPNSADEAPDMRMWLMDSVRPKAWLDARPGRWIKEDNWPANRIQSKRLHLDNGSLSQTEGSTSRYVQSPATCGAVSGEFFPFAFAAELPLDQREEDALSACFNSDNESDLHSDSLDITGAPEVTLTLVPDATTGQIAVRLLDIFPDGTSALITHGVLNLCHHESHEDPKPLEPNTPITVRFALDQIAYRLPAGHHLRLAVSTAYWPYIWPSAHNHGVTITGGAIDLPLRPKATKDECAFEPVDTAAGWAHENLRPADYRRQRHFDYASGESTLTIEIDNGENRDLAHDLVSGSTSTEQWRIRGEDALTAQCQITWQQDLRRGDWNICTKTESTMHCDADWFYIEARVTAFEGDTLVFEKTYEDKIERDLL